MCKKMLCVSTLSFRPIIWVGVGKILIGYRVVSLGIELDGIIIFVDVFNYVFVTKGIPVEHFAGTTPSGINVHKYLFRSHFLCSQGLLHGHPVYLLGRDRSTNKQQYKKCYIFHWKFHLLIQK